MTDSLQEMIYKIAKGNPGARAVTNMILQRGNNIDPYASYVVAHKSLYNWNITGEDIWLMYKDLCGEDLTRMLGMIRAVELGFLTPVSLKRQINMARDPNLMPIDDLLKRVKESLPQMIIHYQYS